MGELKTRARATAAAARLALAEAEALVALAVAADPDPVVVDPPAPPVSPPPPPPAEPPPPAVAQRPLSRKKVLTTDAQIFCERWCGADRYNRMRKPPEIFDSSKTPVAKVRFVALKIGGERRPFQSNQCVLRLTAADGRVFEFPQAVPTGAMTIDAEFPTSAVPAGTLLVELDGNGERSPYWAVIVHHGGAPVAED